MSSSENAGSLIGLLVSLIIIIVVAATCGALSDDPEGAKRAAVDFGFMEPKITATHTISPDWYGCSKGDKVGYEMTAKNAKEEPVNLIVCVGYMKGFTVRVAH